MKIMHSVFKCTLPSGSHKILSLSPVRKEFTFKDKISDITRICSHRNSNRLKNKQELDLQQTVDVLQILPVRREIKDEMLSENEIKDEMKGRRTALQRREEAYLHTEKKLTKCIFINAMLHRLHMKVTMSCSRQDGLIRKNAAYTA